jgi:hypothetical protein
MIRILAAIIAIMCLPLLAHAENWQLLGAAENEAFHLYIDPTAITKVSADEIQIPSKFVFSNNSSLESNLKINCTLHTITVANSIEFSSSSLEIKALAPKKQESIDIPAGTAAAALQLIGCGKDV